MTIEERFWSRVDVRGLDECWPWKLVCLVRILREGGGIMSDNSRDEGSEAEIRRFPNLMQSRHGASENLLQRCAQCQHFKCWREFGAACWVCEELTTPSGGNMPWSDGNRACALFIERVKEAT